MAISLTAQYDRSTAGTTLYGYSLRVTITAAQGMPPEVFIFQRGAAAAPALNEPIKDNFVCIADPIDLDEVPAVAPNLKQEIPYYRLNTVTLSFRDPVELQEAQDFIKDDLRTLVNSMNAMLVFTPQETETYA